MGLVGQNPPIRIVDPDVDNVKAVRVGNRIHLVLRNVEAAYAGRVAGLVDGYSIVAWKLDATLPIHFCEAESNCLR